MTTFLCLRHGRLNGPAGHSLVTTNSQGRGRGWSGALPGRLTPYGARYGDVTAQEWPGKAQGRLRDTNTVLFQTLANTQMRKFTHNWEEYRIWDLDQGWMRDVDLDRVMKEVVERPVFISDGRSDSYRRPPRKP